MDCEDVTCLSRGPARAWMPLAHDDALRKKSTPRRVLGPEVHARDRGELTPSCSVKSIDDRRFMYFVRRRMISSIHEHFLPIKVSYATRSHRGRSDVSMEKTDLPGRLETTQSDRLKPPMT